ncbi:MAG: TonB-dependent receptor [Pseudomonadota bacterium]
MPVRHITELETIQFDIPKQGLAESLRAFARQSGVGLLFPQELVASVEANALMGAYAPDEAIGVLLSGTGLVGSINAEAVLVVSPAPANEAKEVRETLMERQNKKRGLFGLLSTVSVAVLSWNSGSAYAQADGDNVDEIVVQGRMFRDPSDSVATKLNTPLAETAGQVLVLTDDFFDTIGIVSADEAIEFVPGITNFAGGSAGFNFFTARGFGLNGLNAIRVNGAPIGGAELLIDTAALSRLEFVKGSQAASYGQISAGGFVNIALKDAPNEAQGHAAIRFDSFGEVRGEVTYGGPLNDSGTVRALGSYVRTSSPTNFSGNNFDSNSEAAYGTVEVDLTDRLTVSGNAYYFDSEDPLSYGLPLGRDDTDPANPVFSFFNPSRDFFPGGRESKVNTSFFLGQAGANYKINDNHSISATYSQVRVTNDGNEMYLAETFNESYDGGFIDLTPGSPDFGIGTFESFPYRDTQKTQFAELRWNGKTDIGDNAILNFVLSGEYFDQETEFAFNTYDDSIDGFPIDVFNPARDEPNPFVGSVRDDSFVESFGNEILSFSALLNLDLFDRLRIGGGIRYDDREGDVTIEEEGDSSVETFNNEVFSYSASIAYDIVENVTAYYAYSEGFEYNSSLTCDLTTVDPEENRAHEVGVKWEPNANLLGSIAFFDAKSVNSLTFRPCPASSPLQDGAVLGISNQSAQGVEIELVGSITPQWSFGGGISYIDDGFGDIELPSPDLAVKFFTTYDIVDGPLAGFGFGGGIDLGVNRGIEDFGDTLSSTIPASVESFNGVPIADVIDEDGVVRFNRFLDTDNFIEVDLVAYYNVTDNIELRLNGRNVFGGNQSITPAWYGENYFQQPASLIATIDIDF